MTAYAGPITLWDCQSQPGCDTSWILGPPWNEFDTAAIYTSDTLILISTAKSSCAQHHNATNPGCPIRAGGYMHQGWPIDPRGADWGNIWGSYQFSIISAWRLTLGLSRQKHCPEGQWKNIRLCLWDEECVRWIERGGRMLLLFRAYLGNLEISMGHLFVSSLSMI